MREILFRGKRCDNGEWVEGQLLYFKSSVGTDEIALIIEGCEWDNSNEWFNLGKRARIIPETVGQYTGLTDKNGTKIFEGDIVRIGFEDKIWETAREVVFEEGQWFFKCNSNSMKSYIGAWGNSVVEVIGNKHDNPELLGGKGEDNG